MIVNRMKYIRFEMIYDNSHTTDTMVHPKNDSSVKSSQLVNTPDLPTLAGSPFFERKSSKNQILVNVLM